MIGVDLLGVAKYQDAAFRAFQTLGPEYALGCFDKFPDGFGDPYPLIEKLVASGLCRVFRIHLLWRDGHDYKPSMFDKIAEKAVRYDALALRYPESRFYLDGGCEHRLSPENAKKLAQKVAAKALHCVVINTGGKPLKHRINEVHGERPKRPGTPYFVSPDGDDISSWHDFNSRYSDALIRFWWGPSCNGKTSIDDHTPRSKRTNYPNTAEIVAGARLLKK